MKQTINKNGTVTLSPQSMDDMRVLVKMHDNKNRGKRYANYKRQSLKNCPKGCKSKYRGNVGIGIHLSKAHGVKSVRNPE